MKIAFDEYNDVFDHGKDGLEERRDWEKRLDTFFETQQLYITEYKGKTEGSNGKTRLLP